MDAFDSLLKTLFAMAWMVEARDPYTGGHLWRVSQFARRTAEAAGLPPVDVMRIMLGGFLHDLGKIGVPDAILRKPDKLTDEEYAIIKTHPEVGQRILANHPLRHLVEAAVRMHHERPDGRGYPAGLPLDSIPVDARIVGICDAFDAMTSSRPYRQGMPIDKALAIISDNLGSQFDRQHGEHFLRLAQLNQLADIVGHSEPGIPLEHCPACGPIILRTRHHHAGDHLYCPNCTSEVVLHLEHGRARIEPTGRKGTPDQLIPALNIELCDTLIREAEITLPGSRQPPASWWRRWFNA
ncbi:HD-GYP domain-containing protein [Paludibacterium sp. B53371]|uniref:HD-GYP domain-containing protein n=1 Tax=Paludibacterium sp. B53371 TaxID=2806263 RepID=UPI001C05B916|nr:HD-GYP domain-containing protein [Paludibacterium sp. B53371]